MPMQLVYYGYPIGISGRLIYDTKIDKKAGHFTSGSLFFTVYAGNTSNGVVVWNNIRFAILGLSSRDMILRRFDPKQIISIL